jgi:hypothetical protein
MQSDPVLLRLENEADFPQNKVFAQSNLMKCYYDKKIIQTRLFMLIKC